ncbi:hypothetical protein NHP190002_01680 [Helicobacter ailurogastricus]|nr:hypothetical protein [Helicobacter ailurogastricus]GMB89490.1 hypothetical protein NHP190002_01680 [Helicobacter ailurogastricus]
MTDNEYRSFIETSLENIRKAHNENYLSIFAGAGISAGSGLPKWDKLMEILRKKLYGKIEEMRIIVSVLRSFLNNIAFHHRKN